MGACLCCKPHITNQSLHLFEEPSIKNQFQECDCIIEVGRSKVYKTKHIKSGKLITCKHTPLRKKRRYQHEVNMLRLFNSQCLPKFVNTELLADGCYIYYEYIPGKDIFDLLFNDKKNDNIRKLNTDEIKMYLTKMIDCLLECKKYGIVHLDVKFANYIFDEDTDQMYLIDFESAKPVLNHNELSINPTSFGTYDFMPPENWFSHYHNNSDVWSLGVCLWAFLVHKYPFNVSNITKTTDNLYYKIKSRCEFPTDYHVAVMKKYKFEHGIKDILNKIFVFDVRKRITLEELRNHSWLN